MNMTKHMVTVLGGTTLMLLSACDTSIRTNSATPGVQQVSTEIAFDPAGKSPEELKEIVNQSAADAKLLTELLKSGVNYSMRLKEFRRHVETGFAAAKALESHSELEQAQRTAAVDGLRLLYAGVKTDRATFAERFESEVSQRLKADHLLSHSDQLAYEIFSRIKK